MKIQAPAENRITIELSARDMDALNITYEQMDYSNIETRRVVWTLLDRAGHELKRDIDPSGRMIIEAVPAGRGGCVLKFTLCSDGSRGVRQPPSIKKGENTAVYEFGSIDDVMDAARSAEALKTAGCMSRAASTACFSARAFPTRRSIFSASSARR